MQQKKHVSVAIDGNSAAGKSSLAELLRSRYHCNVISMDDFFLQPFQRTPDRLAEPGGNIDYERFGAEVIPPLETGGAISYQVYDCQIGKLSRTIQAAPRPLCVIEGVYSLHPRFIDSYDIKVCLCVDAEEQRRRLLERNPERYDRFINEWIPMENRYFEAFQIFAKCDVTFNTSANN
ncbi:MAG: uridine kinase [Oscillospiraceae bacterium]|jgi:uridine kinase|nr:uridine kinase [Oscillospiraceae bacterium]